jgi:hypothetical protein
MKYNERIALLHRSTYPGHYDAGVWFRGKIMVGVITDMMLIDEYKGSENGSKKEAILAKRIYWIIRDQNKGIK